MTKTEEKHSRSPYHDFAKAFDKVPQARLLGKQKALGVKDQVSSWVEAWLRDRCQRVVVSRETSEWTAVSSRERQGSILGPLFFIVYINDLDEKITSSLRTTPKLAAIVSRKYNDTSTQQWNGRKYGRCNSTPTSVKSCMWTTGTKEPSTT